MPQGPCVTRRYARIYKRTNTEQNEAVSRIGRRTYLNLPLTACTQLVIRSLKFRVQDLLVAVVVAILVILVDGCEA